MTFLTELGHETMRRHADRVITPQVGSIQPPFAGGTASAIRIEALDT